MTEEMKKKEAWDKKDRNQMKRVKYFIKKRDGQWDYAYILEVKLTMGCAISMPPTRLSRILKFFSAILDADGWAEIHVPLTGGGEVG